MREGSANAWMLAAEMVLHPGCTTGIEALLLDRPVMSFVPEPDVEFVNQADVISANVANAAELIALAPTWRAEEDRVQVHVAAGRSALGGFIGNVEPPLAADRILDVLDGVDVPEVGTSWYTLKRRTIRIFTSPGPGSRTKWCSTGSRRRSTSWSIWPPPWESN